MTVFVYMSIYTHTYTIIILLKHWDSVVSVSEPLGSYKAGNFLCRPVTDDF